jgi:Cu/Ag efflux pump CusA
VRGRVLRARAFPALPAEVPVLTWLISSTVRLRRVVVACVVALLGLALVQLQRAKVDVYPEFETTAVEVQAEALGLLAQEVE